MRTKKVDAATVIREYFAKTTAHQFVRDIKKHCPEWLPQTYDENDFRQKSDDARKDYKKSFPASTENHIQVKPLTNIDRIASERLDRKSMPPNVYLHQLIHIDRDVAAGDFLASYEPHSHLVN